MRRIHGYVLLKESNQGVPNLVVCAFDSEIALQKLIGDRPRASVTPALMGKLGKRIGSVLTDKDGAFHLTRDDLGFEGVESRPDLLLMVLAPEDIIDAKRPFVLPPERRLLYISTVPRADAGAEEAYVIRLQQAQLDAFGVSLNTVATSGQQRLASTNALILDHESHAQIREDLRTKFHPQLKEQHKKNVEFRKEAKKNVQLSALPLRLRDHPHLMKDPANLLKLQKEVVTAGLKHLKDDYKPKLRLTLRRAELNAIGMNVRGKGKPRGKIKTLKLADKMRDMLGGVNLVRKEDLTPSAVSAEALHARYSQINDKAGSGSAESGGKKSTAKSGDKKSTTKSSLKKSAAKSGLKKSAPKSARKKSGRLRRRSKTPKTRPGAPNQQVRG
jgi:hypothetical protein